MPVLIASGVEIGSRRDRLYERHTTSDRFRCLDRIERLEQQARELVEAPAGFGAEPQGQLRPRRPQKVVDRFETEPSEPRNHMDGQAQSGDG
jgi:hypothetical protein